MSNLPEAFNLIDGERQGGERYGIINPAAYENTIGFAWSATTELVNKAVAAASRAATIWRMTPLDDRIAAMQDAARIVATEAATLNWAQLLTQEQGKVLAESRLEVGLAQRRIKSGGAIANEALDHQILEDERGRRVRVYDPVGVAAIITPWNWPVFLTVSKVVPALLAGNAVVVKPAPNTPLTVTAVLEKLSSLLPKGTLNVVQGAAEVGTALVAHPEVRMVNFTGSTVSGRRVYLAASGNIKNITLELGGNDPAIILRDAELGEPMIKSLLDATFPTSGQVCMAIKRVYVHESRHDELMQGLLRHASAFVVGDGLAPDSTLGPVNNRMQFDKVNHLTRQAASDGATLTSIGKRESSTNWGGGFFISPTFATNIEDSSALVSEEQFGPVLPVMSYKTTEEAIRRSNNTEYGLSASVWGTDQTQAFDVAEQIEAGVVTINQHGLTSRDPTMFSGGLKQSGLGRQGAVEGMRAFTNARYMSSRRFV